MVNLNNQVHYRNIFSLLNHVDDTIGHISFEDYLSDEDLRMDVFRQLALIGMEAFNVRGSSICTQELEILSSFMKADFLNRFGKEHYAVWNFLQRDLPYLQTQLQTLVHPMDYTEVLPSSEWTA